ncbi:MAG: 3-deoxy-manno-octulosonate cytidylyltransferase [Steroidobacteraceae bacterium]
MSTPFHVVIPARFGASRLAGKPLVDLAGRPLIRWVWECARASGAATVIVATDDARVRSVAATFGADVAMTSPQHISGTDRIAEVVRARGLLPEAIVVNLQGDEPLMPAAVPARVAAALAQHPECGIATAAAPISSLADFLDPSCVKALRGGNGEALYFSRASVPWPRDKVVGGRPSDFTHAWRHIGIYAYRVKSLLEFAGWPPTPLETVEKLEQLRALEHGMRVYVVALEEAPPAGVDTPEDLERVRALLQAG